MNARHGHLAAAAALWTGCALAAVLTPGGTEIVVEKNAPRVVKFAAKEMKHFLDGVLSCDMPVVDAPSGTRTPIHLGSDRWTKGAGISVEGLPRDAFRIVVTDNAVFIAGRDHPKANPERALTQNVWAQLYERATLFGAYEFLERYAGVRMYFPGELGEIIPKTKKLEVSAADFTVTPDKPGRHFSYFSEGLWYEGQNRDVKSTGPLRWLNIYRLRMQTRYIPFNHGLSHRSYLKRFGNSHPEYFRLNKDGSRDMNLSLGARSGKFCYSSGIWEEIYQDAKSYLKGEGAEVRGVLNPHGKVGWWYTCQAKKYFDCMPHDGMVPCECEKCKAAYDRDDPGNYMDTMIWSNMAKIGNRLIAEGVPGYVTQMAYQPYRRVPDVELPTNVLVQVAERGPWSIPYPEDLKREYDEIAAWAKKVGRKIEVWTYPCKYGKRNIPNFPDPSPWLWGQYYKAIAPWTCGIYAESHTDRFVYKHLDYFVLYRVAWNSSVDVDAVIDEYFRLMYGPAADEMKAFFKSLEAKWTTGFLSRGEDTMWGPSFTVASVEDRWNKIYTAKLLTEYERLFAEAARKTAEGSLERRRVELMRREMLEPLVAARNEFVELPQLLASAVFKFGDGKPLTLKTCDKEKRDVPADLRTDAVAEERDGGLFVRIAAHEPDIAGVAALERKFDDTGIWLDNGVELQIDPTGARREFIHLMVNSAGSWTDFIHRKTKSGSWSADVKWNSGAKVDVRRLEDKWICEIFIPPAVFNDGLPKKFPAELYRCRKMKEGGPKNGDCYIWGAFSSGPCDFDRFGTWEIFK